MLTADFVSLGSETEAVNASNVFLYPYYCLSFVTFNLLKGIYLLTAFLSLNVVSGIADYLFGSRSSKGLTLVAFRSISLEPE